MVKEGFRAVVSEWLTGELPEVHEREIEVPLNAGVVISITGPRRAGKTYLMYGLIKKLMERVPRNNILYVNFEHEKLQGIRAEDLGELLTAFYEISNPDRSRDMYLFLDEVQAVDGWARWVNRVYESKQFHIYISGSSSRLLPREIASEMRGRSVSYVVFPYSFRELLRIRNVDIQNPRALAWSEKRGIVLSLLKDYIEYGGYPEIWESPELRDKLLKAYVDAIVIRDVGERFHVEPLLLSLMFEFVISSYSKYFSGSKAYGFLKSMNYRTSKQRPLEVLEYFKEAFLAFPVEITSASVKSKKQYPRKVYVADTGLIHAVKGHVDLGRGMENAAFIELCRRSDCFSEFQVSYWKEYGRAEGREVDFVIMRGGRAQELINVTYAQSRDDVPRREVEGIEMASKELGCDKKTIITWDYYEEGDINYVPLWMWLLEK